MQGCERLCVVWDRTKQTIIWQYIKIESEMM